MSEFHLPMLWWQIIIQYGSELPKSGQRLSLEPLVGAEMASYNLPSFYWLNFFEGSLCYWLLKDMFVFDSQSYNRTFGDGTIGFIFQSFSLLQNELEESFNLENLLVSLRFKRQATNLNLI